MPSPLFSALIQVLLAASPALIASSAMAADPDFSGQPIMCTDPPGAAVPTPCMLTVAPRPDGYEFIGYSFNLLIPQPPPPPFPAIVGMDSMRDFFNPVLQNLFVNIFGNTIVDVLGAPVLFFVVGTLDGVAVASFNSGVLGGLGNALAWNVTGLAPAVPAGMHTLDMHINVVQLIPNQQSQVNVSSLYRATVSAVPEPGIWMLMLTGLGLTRVLSARWRPRC